MNQVIKHIIFLFTALTFVIIMGCEQLEENYNTPEYEQSIKIGVVGDVSVFREHVESMFMGAKLAGEEINKQGGLTILQDDYPIELIFKNSGGSPELGVQVVDELIDEGVQAIIGPTFSSVAIEMAQECIDKEILLMSYSATTPELSMLQDNNLIWRTCPSDFTFGTVSAKHAYDSLEARKAAILYRDDRFGIGLSDVIRMMFNEMGGSITNVVSFPGDEVDISSYSFEAEMSDLLDEEPDIIYIISFSSEIAVLVNKIYNNEQYQNFTKQPYIFANDGILPDELIKNAIPEILETIIGITSTNEGNPNYNVYKNNFINRFGFTPSTYSEHAYDAVYLIAYAMQMCQSTNPSVYKEFLSSVSGLQLKEPVIINVNEFDIAKNILLKGGSIDYEGASGSIQFDDFGDPKPRMVIWGIEDKEYVKLSYYN